MKNIYQFPTFNFVLTILILLSINSYSQPLQSEQHKVDPFLIDSLEDAVTEFSNDVNTGLPGVGNGSNLISTFKNEPILGETVIDFDGNVYQTVNIGDQVWIKENLKSLHYSDGTEITEVWAYDDNESNVEIYGRLYSWDGAMNYSNTEAAQGACPAGWHIPTDDEWTDLEDFLGGVVVAGGKLKDIGTALWQTPNTGATNESGFTALPAGEFDDTHYQLINQYAIFWSSTETSDTWSKYRYLSYNDAGLHTYNYYKSFRYSVRCLKDGSVGINSSYKNGKKITLGPNPAFETLNIRYSENISIPLRVDLYDITGVHLRSELISTDRMTMDISDLPGGLYFISTEIEDRIFTKKFVKN